MEGTVKILVENFNIKDLKYEFSGQDISEVTLPSLKNILKEISYDQDVLFPPRIITNKLIITKHNQESYRVKDNKKISYFRDFDINKKDERKGSIYTLDGLIHIINNSKRPIWKKIFAIVLNFISKAWFTITWYNIIAFFILLVLEVYTPDVNIVVPIFLFWLLIFCFYSLYYGIYTMRKLRIDPQKIKLEYSIPFTNSFETINISEAIIVFGQFFLFGFTVIYRRELNVVTIIVFIAMVILLIFEILTFIRNYTGNKTLKSKSLQNLYKIVYNHLEENEKQVYLQIAIALEKKQLLSSQKIPKFLTLFSLLLTFIPIIAYLFI
ncbi:MAG: hypothetical protein ACFFCV_06430 [Promethearchaeota archaeon]